MTRKDFELIAATIRTLDRTSERVRVYIAVEFADNLASTNPHFDRARFIAACTEGR